MAIQDDTQGVSRVEGSVEQTVGQRIYPPEFFTLGLSGIVCEEERPILEAMS
jgi:hypothetical protein